MRAPNSETLFGGQCRKRPRCCRELKWGSICYGRDALRGIRMSRWSKRKNFLFEELTAGSSQKQFRLETPLCRFPFLFSVPRYFFTSFRLLACLQFPTEVLANPGAAEDAVVVVEDCALTGGDGALRRVKGDAGARIGESFDRCGRGFVLVANFYLRTDRRRGFFGRDPIYFFDFKRGGAQRLVIA